MALLTLSWQVLDLLKDPNKFSLSKEFKALEEDQSRYCRVCNEVALAMAAEWQKHYSKYLSNISYEILFQDQGYTPESKLKQGRLHR